MISLYPDQADLISRVRESMRAGHRAPLLVGAVGSGKTVMFTDFSARAAAKENHVLILAHRAELLDQISNTHNKFNARHGVISPHHPYEPALNIQIGSVFTVSRRLEKITPPDLIIVDEAHHVTSHTTWGRVIKHFPNARVIGVTASPCRLSGESLGDIFDDLIIGPSVRSLILAGRLSDYKIYGPSAPDLSRVPIRAGDFANTELTSVMNRPTITGDAILHYKKLADGKRAIVFCTSVAHARDVANLFSTAGYPAAAIDGSMHRILRRAAIDNFRAGVTPILTSCDLVSEGFDLPWIECGIMLRPTASLGLWIQQTGRCLRAVPGKTHAIILDHAGNTLRHGFPSEDRQWSLTNKVKPVRSARVGVRLCPVCFYACPTGTLQCVECGADFPVEPRQIEQVDGELQELTKRERVKERKRASTLPELIAVGKARGYRPQWAFHVFRARQAKR